MTTSEQLGDAASGQDGEPRTERRAARVRRAFPGGAVRLPRLSRPSAAPPEDLSDEPPEDPSDGPLRRNPDERSPGSDRGFESYYSAESLFEAPAPGPASGSDGPYGALGLTRNASWEQVSKAHRQLVSQLHPDRFVDAEETVRAAAESRVRDVNEAYATIRRQRAVQRA